MKVGVFHPSLYNFGGGEFVALVITNTLAKNGYQTELFVSNRVQQSQIQKMFGEKINPSAKIRVKPAFTNPGGSLDLFPTVFRSLAFSTKCDILIDTYSNCVFPWTDVCYIHYPFLNPYSYRKNFPYLKSRNPRHIIGPPYLIYGKKLENYENKLIIANSKYSANAMKEFVNVNVEVMYPPVPSFMFNQPSELLTDQNREDLVVTVSRFAPEKELEKIPYIAKRTKSNLKFTLIGLLHDRRVYESILENIKRLGLNGRIEVIANASKKEVDNILRRAKIYLHTMAGEHFGISIVEAMAVGCIPIVPRLGGMIEYVPSIYAYETIEEAAEKIQSSILKWTPKRAAKMIDIANQFSESHFSERFATSFSKYIERRDTHRKS